MNGKSTCLMDTGVNAVSTAAAKCSAIGAHLTLPLNQQHNDEMRTAFDALGAEHVALDGNFARNDGKWLKGDGTAVGYFNWYPGEPNSVEDTAYLGTFKNSQWNDFNHYDSVHIVCQQDKPECCTADDIVLECSPNQIELYVPRCFFEKQGVSPSTVFVGEDAAISACQGAFDGLVVFF